MEDDIYRGMHIPKGSMVCCSPALDVWPWCLLRNLDGRCSATSGTAPNIIDVIFDLWSCRAILRDEKIFADPSVFSPERYLEEVDAPTLKLRDPRNYVFGFGRRSVLHPLPHKYSHLTPQWLDFIYAEDALVRISLSPPSGSLWRPCLQHWTFPSPPIRALGNPLNPPSSLITPSSGPCIFSC